MKKTLIRLHIQTLDEFITLNTFKKLANNLLFGSKLAPKQLL